MVLTQPRAQQVSFKVTGSTFGGSVNTRRWNSPGGRRQITAGAGPGSGGCGNVAQVEAVCCPGGFPGRPVSMNVQANGRPEGDWAPKVPEGQQAETEPAGETLVRSQSLSNQREPAGPVDHHHPPPQQQLRAGRQRLSLVGAGTVKFKKETPAQPRGPSASPQAKAFDTTHLGVRVQEPKPPTSGQPQILFSVRGCDGRRFDLVVQPRISVQQLILFAENKPLEDGKVLRDFQPKGVTELLVVHKVYGG